MKSSEKLWARLRDYSLIVVGSLIQAVALRIFLVPAKLASGGVSGIAQIIHHYTDWPIGVMVLIGNIPLFLLGWRFSADGRFAVRTALAIVAYSLAVDLLLLLPFFPKNGLTDDIFLNSLYGAVISGIGYGLVYRARGTSGGSDILARILNHWRGVPMTQSYLMVDSVVILAAGFAFGWKEALYAIVTLYVSGLAAETVLEGGGTVRTAMIVTAKPREIASAILVELERGVTTLAGTGAYTGEERPVLYCVVSRAEIAQIKAIVQETDPRAFMVVGVAHEALGEDFKELKRA
ncbi:MAG: YitT family protein [Anaerolineales bacterium]|nr:YitT family protein [Anaerolineales bacterium]